MSITSSWQYSSYLATRRDFIGSVMANIPCLVGDEGLQSCVNYSLQADEPAQTRSQRLFSSWKNVEMRKFSRSRSKLPPRVCEDPSKETASFDNHFEGDTAATAQLHSTPWKPTRGHRCCSARIYLLVVNTKSM